MQSADVVKVVRPDHIWVVTPSDLTDQNLCLCEVVNKITTFV